MATVIIPAHNEQTVIAGTLDHLLQDLDDDPVQVIVVCNGCTDLTAELAREFAPLVEVLELAEPSKTAAINAGESIARSFPHVILDADVALSAESLKAIIDALAAPGALAAEPRPVFDTARSSYPVQAFYRVWLALHGGRPGDIGSGAYAMSETGRSRFGMFPEIIGDDAYARAHFEHDEIIDVTDSESLVRAPRTTRDLVRIKTRSRLGQWELARKYPELWQEKRARTEPLLFKAGGISPRIWLDVPLYLVIQVWIRSRAAALYRNFDDYQWERDDRTV